VASAGLAAEAEKVLAAHWGPVDDRSALIPFTFSDYYQKEMGAGLLRGWLSFEQLISPDALAALKTAANGFETTFAAAKGRSVNIDPGYITMAKLVLASTKDYSHRIYLSSGIYAEVTMLYSHHRYVTLPWTYLDYQSSPAIEFFTRVREKFHRQLEVRHSSGPTAI
jgi:hypothetical protein